MVHKVVSFKRCTPHRIHACSRHMSLQRHENTTRNLSKCAAESSKKRLLVCKKSCPRCRCFLIIKENRVDDKVSYIAKSAASSSRQMQRKTMTYIPIKQ